MLVLACTSMIPLNFIFQFECVCMAGIFCVVQIQTSQHGAPFWQYAPSKFEGSHLLLSMDVEEGYFCEVEDCNEGHVSGQHAVAQ